MSICPDKNLYSAYVDGEVPSPWKEKLEEHLASCENCRAVVSRYKALNCAVKKADEGTPAVTDDFLASSFKELSPRWELAAEKAIAERANAPAASSRKYAPLHYFAVAAMFLVVAFVPAFFVVKTMEAKMPEGVAPIAQSTEGSMTLAASHGGGYSPRRPEAGSVLVTSGDAQSGMDWTLINQARMFAQDKDVFSAPGNGYVIIRLPEVVRFGGEPPAESEMSSAEGVRGFPPMRPYGPRRGDGGYIINVRQR